MIPQVEFNCKKQVLLITFAVLLVSRCYCDTIVSRNTKVGTFFGDSQMRLLSGSSSTHHEDTNYNCPSNCIKCGYEAPHTCSKCLFKYFPDKKENKCKLCPIERCNLCSTESSCEQCRVGHIPNSDNNGKTCIVSWWFKLVSYALLWSSMSIGLSFFFVCAYFISQGGPTKAPELHHGEDDHHSDSEDTLSHTHRGSFDSSTKKVPRIQTEELNVSSENKEQMRKSLISDVH